jgi:hypothetical protein
MRDNNFAMRIKTILSIAAFSFAFIFSTAFANLFIDKSELETSFGVPPVSSNTKPTSCFGHHRANNSVADKIEFTLQQDDNYGREREAKLRPTNEVFYRPSFADYVEATSEYADKSGSLNDGGLPQDFQIAWQKHMKVWRDYSNFLGEAETMNLNETRFIQLNRMHNQDINLTWQQVLLLSAKYGAAAPAQIQ